MRLFIIYLLLIFSVFADGGFVLKTGEHATEPSQRATIFYADGIQDTFLQVSLEGEVSEFGWLVPVPAKPNLEQVDKIPEFGITEHFPQTPYRNFMPLIYLSNTSFDLEPNFKEKKKVLLDYTIDLFEPSGNNFSDWLLGNHFKISKKTSQTLKKYRQNDWYICAIKLNASADKKNHDLLLPPIKFSFKTDHPVFPLQLLADCPSDTFVNIQFISKEIYSPNLDIFPKDIQSEKDYVKYFLQRDDVPNNFVYQPVQYGKTSAINLSSFRKIKKNEVYKQLYAVNFKKWYRRNEVIDDLYFRKGTHLMFNNLKKQFDISMHKVINNFDFHRFDNFGSNLIKDSHTPEFKNMANYFTMKQIKELTPLTSTYRNIKEQLMSVFKCEFKGLNVSEKVLFHKYDEEHKKIISKQVSIKRLIELAVDSFNTSSWDPEFIELKNDYQICTLEKRSFNPKILLPSHEKLIKLTDKNQYGQLNSYHKLVTDATHNGLVFKELTPNNYHEDVISQLEKIVTTWNPHLNIIQKTTNIYEEEMQLLSNFVKVNNSDLLTKKYSSDPIIGKTAWRGTMLTRASSAYSVATYFYETNLYLRKVVIQRFQQNKDFFYVFGDESGNSLPINNLFLKHVTKKSKELIPVLIEWVKSDNKYLKHNAIIALSHLSFLSLDNNTKTNAIIANYIDDLEKHLPLKPFSRNSGDFWSYVLRLNYSLPTGSFAQQYFDIFSELKHNSQQDDKSYQFNSAKVYRALSNFCDLYEDEVEMTRAEQEKQLSNLLFKKSYRINNKKSHIEQIIDLFWSEVAMKAYQSSSDQISFSGAKLKLIADLKTYPKGPYFDGDKIDDTVYYATAFVDDPAIKNIYSKPATFQPYSPCANIFIWNY